MVAGGVLPDCALTDGVAVDVLACAKELTAPWASSAKSNTNGRESNLVPTGMNLDPNSNRYKPIAYTRRAKKRPQLITP